ncbi:MAG: DNA-3-methyladenine glycosylase [Bacteroidales bacterium]|jgi:DNA-3-methyladenine glycosylase|nr:DNA-3-methyladenine glycosylase [Bacteroidales bacterium]
MQKLGADFFTRDVLIVAPELIGRIIQIKTDKKVENFRITETEAYRGEEDLACHARKGKTSRTAPMYETGGILYIYLIYGMHWMLNIVTAEKNNPQAVLIRGVAQYNGPGKLTKRMGINKKFNYLKIYDSEQFQLFDDGFSPNIAAGKRIGIDYAGEVYKNKAWRYFQSE